MLNINIVFILSFYAFAVASPNVHIHSMPQDLFICIGYVRCVISVIVLVKIVNMREIHKSNNFFFVFFIHVGERSKII